MKKALASVVLGLGLLMPFSVFATGETITSFSRSGDEYPFSVTVEWDMGDEGNSIAAYTEGSSSGSGPADVFSSVCYDATTDPTGPHTFSFTDVPVGTSVYFISMLIYNDSTCTGDVIFYEEEEGEDDQEETQFIVTGIGNTSYFSLGQALPITTASFTDIGGMLLDILAVVVVALISLMCLGYAVRKVRTWITGRNF